MAVDKSKPKKLYRTESDKVIAGVAGGLGKYFDLDPVLFRLGFLVLLLFGGGGFLIYIMLWIIMPAKHDLSKNSKDYLRENAHEIKVKAESLVDEIQKGSGSGRNTGGLILIAIGAFFLIRNFGLFDWLDFERFWPLFLILLGLFALQKRP